MTFYEQHYLDLIVTFYEWHYLDLIVTFYCRSEKVIKGHN